MVRTLLSGCSRPSAHPGKLYNDLDLEKRRRGLDSFGGEKRREGVKAKSIFGEGLALRSRQNSRLPWPNAHKRYGQSLKASFPGSWRGVAVSTLVQLGSSASSCPSAYRPQHRNPGNKLGLDIAGGEPLDHGKSRQNYTASFCVAVPNLGLSGRTETRGTSSLFTSLANQPLFRRRFIPLTSNSTP